MRFLNWMSSQMEYNKMSWKFTAVFDSALIIILGSICWGLA